MVFRESGGYEGQPRRRLGGVWSGSSWRATDLARIIAGDSLHRVWSPALSAPRPILKRAIVSLPASTPSGVTPGHDDSVDDRQAGHLGDGAVVSAESSRDGASVAGRAQGPGHSPGQIRHSLRRPS